MVAAFRAVGVSDDRQRPDDQHLPQIAVALLRDPAEPLLAAAGVLPRHEPDPGGQVPARPERLQGPGSSATRALASSGPTPGTSISRRPTSVARALALIRRSSLEDLVVHQRELRRQHRKAGARFVGYTFICVGNRPRCSCAKPLRPIGATIPNSRHVPADRVRELDALTHQHQPNPMQHHHALLLGALHLDEAHGRPGHRLADRLGISRIVLLPLHVRLHVARRHQPHIVAKLRQFASPVVSCGAGLDADQAGRQLREERTAPSRASACLRTITAPLCIDAVHLEH